MSRPLVISGTLPGGAPFQIAMDPHCYVVMIATLNYDEPIVCTRHKPRTIDQARAIGEVALALLGEGPADTTNLNHGVAPRSPRPQPDPDPPDDDPIGESPRERIARALANDNGLSWDEADAKVWLEYADACLRQTRKFVGR